MADEERDRRRRLLRAWTAIERFGTTTLGRTVRSDRRVAVDVEPDEPLPWEPGHAAYGRRVVSDRVEWRHTLHIGQFDIGAAYAAVEAKFPDSDADAEEERRRPYGLAPLLAVTVTGDGRPLVDTLQVSSAAWSIARTLRMGVDDPRWLEGFGDAADGVGSAFTRLMVEVGDRAAREALGIFDADEADDAGVHAAEPLSSHGAGTSAAPTSGPGAPAEGRTANAPTQSKARDRLARMAAAAAADGEELHWIPGADDDALPSELEPPAPDDPDEPAVRDLLADLPPAIDEDGIATVPITWEVLGRLLALARKILELDGHITIRPVVRTTSWQQAIRAPHSHGDTLLNSFAVADLDRVARDLAGTRGRPPGSKLLAPSALELYLDADHLAAAAEFEESEARDGDGGDEPSAPRARTRARVDVDVELDHVRDRVHPSRYPAGRWPADARHDLALGQQLAVNLALDPDGPTIVAVNGPPGTGKTTMLRDLIAGVVTERAQRIAQLSSPDDVFGARFEHRSDDRRVIAHRVHSQVSGHELLLACATNAAAQNVSLELPTRDALGHEWAGRPGALADFATAALRAAAADDARAARDAPIADGVAGQGRTGPGPDAEAWAMVSARLGRRSYGKAFAEAIWWGTPAWADRSRTPAVSERVAVGLSAVLTSGRADERRKAWIAARDRFTAAHAEVERLREERTRGADRLAPPPQLRARVAAHRTEVDALEAALGQLVDARTALATTVAGHLRERALGAAKKAIARVQRQDREIEDAQAALDAAQAALDADEDALRAREQPAADAGPDGEVEASIDAAGPSGSRTPWLEPDGAWERDRAGRDLRAPWSDEAWNRARTECFLAALDLHEATLIGAGRKAQQNLRVAFDLLSGRVSGLPADITQAAWQTLFLLVPVISTTFASMPTLLSGLRRESLGWLLVDEAGQAEPQQVVGGLWRCRRAVIVGDPLQLDPVTTLPGSLAEAIRVHHGIDAAFIGAEASVQRLADASTPWGGRRGADDLWVGVPMNVHRRCEGPIFDLVNAIAYGGRMVNATAERSAHPALRVPSCWLDVPQGPSDPRARGRRGDGHWRPAEGERLDDLLAHLHREGYDFSELFAVSPFRDVARQLEQRARHHRGMTGGTVHTIQGREADTVILVLGGDPARHGARAWAAAKPNLLNVAVSRARQRLYVIGDHAAWAHLPYFRELAGLRRVPPRERAAAR
ncbi:MAG: AAA domain-containing protein [Patulibacter minatonensis]